MVGIAPVRKQLLKMKRASDLKFDVSSILQRIKTLPKLKVKGVSINLPFITIDMTASDAERKIAREVLIRLRDKRVLVVMECCDDCIRNALTSIQNIRALLIDKQVELPDDNSGVFLLFDLMLAGIRQFITFVESYDSSPHPHLYHHDYFIHRDEYFGALEVLRGHLLRCIEKVAKLANTTPKLNNRLTFYPEWEKKIYVTKSLPELSKPS